MNFEKITPEQAGVRSEALARYIELINKRQIPLHSLLMMKGDKLFCEYYWAPYDKDTTHRMYSQTKSYVSIAIGLLREEGKLKLTDRICDHFPDKIHSELPSYLKELTIREMLTMTTAGTNENWFTYGNPDRTNLYMNTNKANHPTGTLWEYDSAGSQVLSALVERLSGKTLFDYLNEKVFSKLGTFKTATILKTGNGDSWGDSALVCTPRDMISFATLLKNGGVYEGEQLIPRDYLDEATSKRVDNRTTIRRYAFRHGYGYQIWRTERNGFAFVGMGNQLTVMLPDDDIVFVCTADCQGDDGTAREYIINHFFELIMDDISKEPIEGTVEGAKRLEAATENLELIALSGLDDSPYREVLNGKTYKLAKNNMGITELSFVFKDKTEGELRYKNAQGDKVIPFGVNKNVFGYFPELGYSNERGSLLTTDGFTYRDAVSLAWLEEKKLLMYVQVIDRYLGTLVMQFGFRDNEIYLIMSKCAENFLEEYNGRAIGRAEE